IDQVDKEISALNEEIANVKTQIDQEKETTQAITDKLSDLNQALESNKARLMDLVAQEAQYKNIYQTTINNKESLQKRLSKVDEDQAQATNQINRARE
ncbi:hypothetical protein GWN26_06095, partial [Candidatus Saccharibacteria bacterium]|nr:hypothetical protein [Candidatus Saccharibacteria bacterium]NIW78983.1 hypothetical protein [Calditrichia bacterium]